MVKVGLKINREFDKDLFLIGAKRWRDRIMNWM